MMRNPRPLLALLGSLLLPAVVSAKIVYVRSGGTGDGTSWANPLGSVQAGLNAASSGDEVWVAKGAYIEPVTLHFGVGLYGGFASTETDRAARNPAANVTTIQGGDYALKRSVVVVPSGAGRDTVLDGFTLSHGYGTTQGTYTVPLSRPGPARYGGGIYCRGASPTITGNVITGNTAGGDYYTSGGAGQYVTYYGGGWGGGLYIENGAPLVSGNTISSNGAWNEGGGMMVVNAVPVLRDNVFEANTVEYPHPSMDGPDPFEGKGGGISIHTSTFELSGQVFRGNNAYRQGGGAYITGGAMTVRDNDFIANTSETGGGLWTDGGTVVSNRFAANLVKETVYASGLGIGGGVYAKGSVRVERNEVRLNNAIRGGGIYAEAGTLALDNILTWNTAQSGGGAVVAGTFVNNTLAHNLASTGGALSSLTGATVANNIAACNSSGFHQEAGTPAAVHHNCLYSNSYMPGLPGYLTGDLTGALSGLTGTNLSTDPRLANPAYGNLHIRPDSPCKDAGDSTLAPSGAVDVDGQPRIQGASVDIGADESDGTVWTSGPPATLYVSATGNDAQDGKTPETAKRTVQAGIDALPGGGDVWIAGGTYPGPITLKSYTYLHGTAGDPAVLDGQALGSTVTVPDDAGDCGMDGLTIQNGSTNIYPGGGGVQIRGGQAAISRCTIRDNVVSHYVYFGGGGGGIALEPSGVMTLTDSTITGNKGFYGGGAGCEGTYLISNCRITGNRGYYEGAGLYLRGTGVVQRNIIADNGSLTDYVDGGGAYVYGNVVLASNNITGNAGRYSGIETLQGVVANNTIVGNVSSSATVDVWYGPVTLVNNIIAFNSQGVELRGSKYTVRNNDVFGNASFNYAGLTDLTGTNGNISADPLFVNAAAGDYRLAAGSPARDAGDDSVLAWISTDFTGAARKLGAHVDIGAYEAVTVSPTLLSDAADALRVAAGLQIAAQADLTRLDVVSTGTSQGVLGGADAVCLVRRAFGLDATD